MGFYSPDRKAEVGAVVWYEGRVWRVGLVNDSRQRLDPVTGSFINVADPASGRSFVKYGNPISISPHSILEEVDLSTLDEPAINRLIRMQEAADLEEAEKANRPVSRVHHAPADADADGDNEEEEEVMATAAAAPAKAAAAPANVAPPPGAVKTKADLNRDRLAQVKANKEARAGQRAEKTAANVAAGKTKAVKRENPCKCGCGGVTGGFFVPGHDARFKGWMANIERGKVKKADVLTPEVIAQYKWIKVAGGGERATTTYKGEPNSGYAPPMAAANAAKG